jgi:prepilin-type processing-associated H-X9-DG protein
LYAQITSRYGGAAGTWAPWGPHPTQAAYEPWRARIPLLWCPSDTEGRSRPDTEIGKVNYCFCWGDHINTANRAKLPRGMFGKYSYVTTAGVRDGLSHTLALSETAVNRGPGRRDSLHGGYVIKPGVDANPSLCAAALGVNGKLVGTLPTANDRRGDLWCSGWPLVQGFNTVLPPNGPKCALGSDPGIGGIYTADSYHPSGVNALMADGSVRFISETIDVGDLTRRDMVGQNGPSPFGVWGALGSKAGGDNASDAF